MNFSVARLDFIEKDETDPRHIDVYFSDTELLEYSIFYQDGIAVEARYDADPHPVFVWSDGLWVPDEVTQEIYLKCLEIGRQFVDFLKGGVSDAS